MRIPETILTIASLSLALASCTHKEEHTRGIGVYPGRPSETAGPVMKVGGEYRNVALDRAVYQSSSLDANLTGQLVTDGITAQGEPVSLQVSTPQGVIGQRDREKVLDMNHVTSVNLQGEETFIRLDWTSMEVAADAVDILAEVVYYPEKAGRSFEIALQVSKDGESWKTAGVYGGRGLPGEATRQKASNDPNKNEDVIMLPMRLVNKSIDFGELLSAGHIRLNFNMEGAAYWRLRKVDFKKDGKIIDVLPSLNFSSAWASRGGKDEWLMVDLGAEADVDSIKYHWIHPAGKTDVFVSRDSRSWKKAESDKFRARYVKILMNDPDESGHFVLSELEMMGRGGAVAMPSERKGMEGNRYYLNGGDWKLARAGSSHTIQATVPATALTSYINVGAVPEPFVSDNMRQISESYFRSDFIYTTTFDCPEAFSGRRVYLNLDGVNWKASVKVNGTAAGRIEGAFKRGCFDITSLITPSGNTLEVTVEKNEHFGPVKVKNTETTDLNGGILGADNPTFHATIGWDWITSTPGREVGIWNDVYLTSSEGVRVSDPVVLSRVDGTSGKASMTAAAILRNDMDSAADVIVRGWIGDIKFEKKEIVQAGSELEVEFGPEDFPQLRDREMNLWWPSTLGEPFLYDAGFEVECGGKVSDAISYKAGIREMTYAELDSRAQIMINGVRVDPLGGNWGFSEGNLRYRAREYDIAVAYHKDMHCNMIRNWVGQIGDEEFYEACDRHGLMVWQDFWLANPWDGPDPYDEAMFMDNAEDYIKRIRRHPSIAIYVGRNEGYPPENLDRGLRNAVASLHPGLGFISSSADDGVSGHGPYWAVSDSEYFSLQTGKLHSERGMPNVPNIESLLRMLSPEEIWPVNEGWAKHDFTMLGAQRGREFMKIMSEMFGEASSAEEFTEWAQWINYDGYRAMFESSQTCRQGLLIWMSHPCWPSIVWQTYDYYFDPTAAYFGTKKACEPVHIQYNPLAEKVQLVNISRKDFTSVEAYAEVLDIYGRQISADTCTTTLPVDTTLNVMDVRVPEGQGAYYLRLSLKADGEALSDNFYVRSAGDSGLKSLLSLPAAEVNVKTRFRKNDGTVTCNALVSNDSDVPALMIRLNLKGTDGEQILPAFYSDNYFHLMPGESRTVEISYRAEDARGVRPVLETSCLND